WEREVSRCERVVLNCTEQRRKHRMSVRRRPAGLGLVVASLAMILALGLAACGGGDGTAGGGGTSEAGGKESGPPATGASGGSGGKEQVSVGMGLILSSQQFGVELREGAEAYGDEDGAVDLEVQGPAAFDPEAAQKQILDMLAK